MKLSFFLCIPRRLLSERASAADPADPALWSKLPFAAGSDGGQLDRAIRGAMQRSGVDFSPRFECGSMLQVRQLVIQGNCAAVLPNLALAGIDQNKVVISPFAPLADYGRDLVLHWNSRRMEVRGVGPDKLGRLAAILAERS